MKRNDEILKYLSDLMNDKEKAEFEREISLSDDLGKEVEKYQSLLGQIKFNADIKEDSPYFQNLLPRVREKIGKGKVKRLLPRAAYLVPTLTAVALIIINIGKFTPEKAPVNNTGSVNTVKKTEVKTAEKGDEQYLNADYSVLANLEYIDAAKSEPISFEVGLKGNANQETIQKLADRSFVIPYMEDYFLASK